MRLLSAILLLAAATPVRAQFEQVQPALEALALAAAGQRERSAAAPPRKATFQVPTVDLGTQYNSGTCYAHAALGYLDTLAELYGRDGEKTFYPNTTLILLSLDSDSPYLHGLVDAKRRAKSYELLFDGGSTKRLIYAAIKHPSGLIPVSFRLNELLGEALLYREPVYQNSDAGDFRKKLARNLYGKLQKALNGRLRTEALAFVADLEQAGFTLDDARRSVVYAAPASPVRSAAVERLQRKNIGHLFSQRLPDLEPARCEEVAFQIVKASLESGHPVLLSVKSGGRTNGGQSFPRHAMLINRLEPSGEGYQVSVKNSWAGPGKGTALTYSLRALCRAANDVELTFGVPFPPT